MKKIYFKWNILFFFLFWLVPSIRNLLSIPTLIPYISKITLNFFKRLKVYNSLNRNLQNNINLLKTRWTCYTLNIIWTNSYEISNFFDGCCYNLISGIIRLFLCFRQALPVMKYQIQFKGGNQDTKESNQKFPTTKVMKRL